MRLKGQKVTRFGMPFGMWALFAPSFRKQLNAAFDARLNALLAENADASKGKQYHLK